MNAPVDHKDTADRILAFVHIGDLHLTDAKQRNFLDLLAIVAQIEIECARVIDFVALPGDNADNGLQAQYALAATALKMLSVPVYAIPGDHDMEQGNLDAFYAGLVSHTLPLALTIKGNRCLFLDFCSYGGGGPDFRLGTDQISWLGRELEGARERGETSLLFMHSYPADLKSDGETEALNRLIDAHDVALVDMGHTHYNELANDGRTIFAATRSTGQIEEGPVGYSIATLDNGIVSWRFKALDDAFPFVIITAPADHRLIRSPNHTLDGSCEVRALAFGARRVQRVECRVQDDDWTPMICSPGGRLWTSRLSLPTERLATITVQAVDETGRPGQHSIRAATKAYVTPARTRDGSDAASIGAWPENSVFATQLGPNRNGKPS
jgi:3',5'-cyclic-AMP phosphodiesterase